MAKEIIYSELIKDFRVDEDGRLFRLSDRWGREREVVIKSNHITRYCIVRWNDKKYHSHRLLYCLYHKIDIPADLHTDHIDGNRINNSVENLRLVNARSNCQNRECHRIGKLLGTSFNKLGNKYQSFIRVKGKKISLGLFDTEIEAHEVYLSACNMLDKSIDEIKEYFNIKTKDKCSSKYKCVHWSKKNKKWVAQAACNSKYKYLGSFLTEEAAHQAVLDFKNNLS